MAKKPKVVSGGSLLDRIKATSSDNKYASMIEDSEIFDKKTVIKTRIPMINVALSGNYDGGLTSGLTVLAGPSKHFKSLFALVLAKAFMDANPDGYLVFYDNEFGTPKKYFKILNIDMKRVFHIPITNIEELKQDIAKKLASFEREDKVMILVDSLGNLASIKEVNDALTGNEAADMTRTRAMKSLFRVVTPHLSIKDIPMVVINHTYKTMEMFSKDVVSGGTGVYYSADNIWILGRQQAKEGDDLAGWNFIINIEKSRHAQEKTKIAINVNFETGINKWSGMLENAVEAGILVKPVPGKYCYSYDKDRIDVWKEKNIIASDKFWNDFMNRHGEDFKAYVNEKYAAGSSQLIREDEEFEMDTSSYENEVEDLEEVLA